MSSTRIQKLSNKPLVIAAQNFIITVDRLGSSYVVALKSGEETKLPLL